MAGVFKIHGATPKGGPSLCRSCKNAKMVTGQNGEEIVKCHTFDRFVGFRVATCTEWHPMNMPWKYEMEDMAWIVQARKRGPAGFKDEQGHVEYEIKPPQREEGTPE